MEVLLHTRRFRDDAIKRIPISPPGSRNGYWDGDCPVHGRAPFNTIIDGCELCAANRIAKEDESTCQPLK